MVFSSTTQKREKKKEGESYKQAIFFFLSGPILRILLVKPCYTSILKNPYSNYAGTLPMYLNKNVETTVVIIHSSKEKTLERQIK